MKANLKRTVSLLIICSKVILINAQELSRYEIGGGLGAYVYQGDLAPSAAGSFKTMRPGLHLYGNMLLSSSFSYRLNVAIAGLRGDESKYSKPEYMQQRNFAFKTPVIELSGLGVWDIRGKNFDRTRGALSPYAFTGIGLSFLNIKPDSSRFNAEYFSGNPDVANGLAIDAQKKLPKIQPVIPIGLGLRYELSDRFAITTEATYRLVFTDYLDGFSYAVNPKLDDHYVSQTFGIIYKLGKKNSLNCPRVTP
jgi:Domain of unknown function (DUF6089)